MIDAVGEIAEAGISGEPVPGEIGAIFARCYESLADAVISAREVLALGLYHGIIRKDIRDKISLVVYACECPSRGRRTPMDVDKMVEQWLPEIKKMALAHDFDERDKASAALDEMLMPVVAAPVAQIRDFYRKLTAALKADTQVPFALYRLFEFWGENVLDKVETENILELKKELATKIAERSITEIPTQDWIDSMIGALMWRSEEALKKIDASLDEGKKPRVKGRESCLFLEIDEEVKVML